MPQVFVRQHVVANVAILRERRYNPGSDTTTSPLDQRRFMECKQARNLEQCTCTYACSRKGLCCDCVSYHLKARQLPGCFFPPDAERTYDRSFAHFARLVAAGKIG